MARRGQNQKLQTEINTDEELKAFIEAPCLLGNDLLTKSGIETYFMFTVIEKTYSFGYLFWMVRTMHWDGGDFTKN